MRGWRVCFCCRADEGCGEAPGDSDEEEADYVAEVGGGGLDGVVHGERGIEMGLRR